MLAGSSDCARRPVSSRNNVLLMGQLQEAGDLGAGQRAALLQIGKLAGFGRDSLLLAMKVLDGVLQAGLLLQGQLDLDIETLLAEKPRGSSRASSAAWVRLLAPWQSPASAAWRP